jgi:hypothetical protein
MRKGKVNNKSECKCGGIIKSSPTVFLEQGMYVEDWNKCDKKDVCAGHPSSCSTCKHRHGDKKNYYEPEFYPYYPYTGTYPGVYPETISVKYG